MAAPVRIEAKAWSDIRFVTLARLLGLADADHAIIKVARIWSWQTEHFTADRPTYSVDLDTIESVLGPGGAAALVRSRLAVETPEGYRMCGTEGQIEWCEALTSKRQQAGLKRARNASRDAKGRMIGNEYYSHPAHAGCAGPASTSTHPAQSSAPTPTPAPDLRDPDLPPARDPTTQGHQPQSVVDASLELRQAARQMLWREFAAIREAVAAELGVICRPLPAHDPGERALALRIRDQNANLQVLVADARHVMAVAKAEAIATSSVQWLTGALFEDRSYRRALGMTLEDATRPRAGPSSARGTQRVGRVEPLPASAYGDGDLEI